jgi:hypothetical protein
MSHHTPWLPIRVFFQGQNVPPWFQKVSVLATPRSSGPPKVIFGSPSLCICYKNQFFVWAPLTNYFLKCFINITGNGNEVTLRGGRDGVSVYFSLFKMLAKMRSVAKGAKP